jgi:transposase
MSKRLSIEQIEHMKSLVQEGVAPEDIAKKFNVAVSSVHNYKARFKADGMTFPNVRGKRPVGEKKLPEPKQVTGVIQKTEDANFKFIVNGVSVQISAQAKSVNIDKNTMEIKF